MRLKSESGYVLVTVAVMLAVLIGFTGLAMDLGTSLSARTQMQRAADAAALAGAFSLVVAPTDENGLFNGDGAIAKATEVATRNNVLGDPILASEVTAVPRPPDHPTRGAQMQVTIRRTLPTFFARVLGFNVLSVSSSESLAEVGPEATGSKCVKPWLVSNTSLSANSICTAYANGELLVNNNTTTSWATSRFGRQFTLKPNDPQDATAPNTFLKMNPDGCSSGGGTRGYVDAITSCSQSQVVCRQTYCNLPGNVPTPTTTAVQQLIGAPQDIYRGAGRYQWADGSIHDTSKSLVLAPIVNVNVDVPTFCSQGGRGGNLPPQQPYTVVGFALVFIDSAAAGDNVMGRIVDVLPCGDAAPSGNQLDGTVYGFPIRLVRPIGS